MRFPLLLVFMFLPVSAFGATYDCLVTKRDGPFAERMMISFADDGSAVRIDDGLVRHYEGAAVDGKVGEFTGKKQVATWRVTMTNRKAQTTRMSYRAAVFANGKLVLTAKPHGFSNNFTARGRCRKV